jgi:hypothetical protein
MNNLDLKFKELLEKVKKYRNINRDDEVLAYHFFKLGYLEGSGMTQLAI